MEEAEADTFNDYEYDESALYIHAPETVSATPYCKKCKKTYWFEWKSYPGDREYTELKCPHCQANLGGADCEIVLLAEADGNIGSAIRQTNLSGR